MDCKDVMGRPFSLVASSRAFCCVSLSWYLLSTRALLRASDECWCYPSTECLRHGAHMSVRHASPETERTWPCRAGPGEMTLVVELVMISSIVWSRMDCWDSVLLNLELSCQLVSTDGRRSKRMRFANCQDCDTVRSEDYSECHIGDKMPIVESDLWWSCDGSC